MSISVTSLPPGLAAGRDAVGLPGSLPSASSFGHLLSGEMRELDRQTARRAVGQLVSWALIVPVLSSLRQSPFATGPFAPGAAERRFGPLLDWHIADRITEAANFPLIDAMVDRLAPPAASEPAGPGPGLREQTHGAG